MVLSNLNQTRAISFINLSIKEKTNSRNLYMGSHDTDYDEYNNGGIYHTDVDHEDEHTEGWAGYVDVDKLYTDNYWKEEPHW